MDPVWNCILTICCDPLQADRRTVAMSRLLVDAGMTKGEAAEYAPVVLKAIQPLIDVLQPFIGFIAGLARGADFKE